jgi:hypothetical protein
MESSREEPAPATNTGLEVAKEDRGTERRRCARFEKRLDIHKGAMSHQCHAFFQKFSISVARYRALFCRNRNTGRTAGERDEDDSSKSAYSHLLHDEGRHLGILRTDIGKARISKEFLRYEGACPREKGFVPFHAEDMR